MTRRLESTTYIAGLAVVTVLALIEVTTSIRFVGALAIGVFVAALAASPRRVGITGLYALAWAALLGYQGEHWNGGHLVRLALVSIATIIAVVGATQRRSQQVKLARTENVAAVAQRALLHPLASGYDGVEMAVRYLSSDDGAVVGGDVYVAEATGFGLRVLVADVCGHGLDAVDKASLISSAFREAAHSCRDLLDVASVMEKSVERNFESWDFATALLAELIDGDIRIANCGHPDPLVVGPWGVRWISPDRRTRPIGLGSAPTLQYMRLRAGERLLLYSDGLTEARDRNGTSFGLEDRVAEYLCDSTLDEALDRLIDDLHAHAGTRLRDDVIAFAIEMDTAR